MKIKLFLLLLLLAVPLVYADISVKNVKKAYNLGDTITPEVKVTWDEDSFSGFLRADIICNNFSTVFYVTPISMSKAQSANSYLPQLPVQDAFIGTCVIKTSLEKVDKTLVSEQSSNEILITDQLTLILDENIPTFDPSDMLTLKGVVQNARKESVTGMAKITLKGESYSFVISSSNFSLSVKIPSDIKSGANEVSLHIEDGKNNFADKKMNIQIVPKSTKLEIQMEKTEVLPYEELSADLLVYDQALDIMEKTVDAKILDKKGKEILNSKVENRTLIYPISNSLEPGTYKLTAAADKITKESEFKILPLTAISSKLVGDKVTVTNIGNVKYANTTIITLMKDDAPVTIEKSISLKPGESIDIDVSKQVKAGVYSVILPTGEQINEVEFADNRGFMTKAFSGFGSVSGNAVKGVSSFGTLTGIFVICLIVIAIAAALYYLGIFRKKE